ncbi:mitochondrial fission protein ELM1 [Azospirillum rugosum]|uniref:Mitochondrial fission protein ELM1 n=2 Tax=Azospirillum rugosum TaxID=416170 RepID=A0ABS4SRE1_9PROT|nr:mitochondrial fission ELM1 family protein [Azospirillum rugosum]MBP2295119.1 mitochondrial fission protein ELM1 [Azospirillum rugosum]MDQ0528493.1 mitochondrial fission protein ELM1 [Azospirillum rugosum]
MHSTIPGPSTSASEAPAPRAAAPRLSESLTCWVVTDGKPGMENQCLGLAEALGLTPVVKRVQLRSPWRQLSPYLRVGNRFAAGPNGDPIEPPWPDLLIGTGRRAIAPSLAVRKASAGRTFTVQIQDPMISPRHFDMVVVPRHDRLRGPNVMVTRGALHRVTPRILADAAERHAPRLAHLPHPRVAVLIGGNNGVYALTPTIMGDVAEKLADLARQHGAGLMVTPSRRTGADNEAILRARLRDLPAEVWDGTGENPYFAYLGLADVVVVTCDSVSMTSEACSTGKPVYVIELDGGSPKFRAFHDGLYQDAITRPFTGELDRWTYTPMDETRIVAEELRQQLAAHRARMGR